MEEVVLKWSCDHRKFLKILSSKTQYRERLGYKLNAEWYLKVIFETTQEERDPNYYIKLKIYLERKSGTNPTTVTSRLISNTIMCSEAELKFNTEISSLIIGSIFTTKLTDYRLDAIFIFDQSKESQIESPKDENYFIKTNHLKENLLSLLHKKHLADVTLKCGSEVLKAHKAVLCARSPVFEAMFGNAMQESKTNTVTIEDMDTSVFEDWICFVYGGAVKITSVDVACNLLDAGEKYQMVDLKKMCVDYLESVLSTENAVQLLEVANLYDNHFKANVISYIADNFSELKLSEGWCNLKSTKPELALEVYSYEKE